MDVERELRGIAGPDPDRSFERVAAFLTRAPRGTPRRRRWILATPLALVLIAAIPIPHEEPIGQLLRWRVTDRTASLRRLDALPWAARAMRFAEVPAVSTGKRAVLLVFVPHASESDARAWQRELARLPGTEAIEQEALSSTVRRPLGSIAAREWIGLRFGRELSREEIERRAGAVLESLAAGSVVVKIETDDGDARMLVAGSPSEVLAKSGDQIVLLIVKRNPSGPDETVSIELDAAELERLPEEERTRRVRAELRRHGILNVDVLWENGELRIRSRATPRPTESGPAASRR